MLRRLAQLTAVLCGLMALALSSGALQIVSVASSSMSPTMCAGDRLLVWTVGAGGRAGPRDVVTLRAPAGGGVLLKRVIAVTGQAVEVVDGRLVVDGQPQDEDFLDLESVDGTFFGPVTVSRDSVFVLGDERERSVDSRDFGDVLRADITGVVLRRLGSDCR